MRRWKPQPSALLWVAALALLAAAAGAGYSLWQIATRLTGPPASWPINSDLFAQLLGCLALLLLAGALAYRIAAALTLAYAVDRNGLYITWLGNRAVVPLQQIERVDSGLPIRQNPLDRLRSAGYYHGQVRLPEGGVVHRFSTRPLAQALVLHTLTDAYAISPREPDAFVQELEQRRRLGAIQQLNPGVASGRALAYAFWNQRVVRICLGLAFLLNLALLGWLMTIFPALPELIVLRGDAAGAATALVPRHQILFLPLAAAALGLMNLGLGLSFYRREPAGAMLLQIASVGVQILFLVAALSVVLPLAL